MNTPRGVRERVIRIGNRLERLFNFAPLQGTLGDAQGNIMSPLLPLTHVKCMVQTDNGLLPDCSAYLPSDVKLEMYPSEPILLGYDKAGKRFVVLRADTDRKAAAGRSTTAIMQQSVSPSTPQAYLETLRLIAKTGFLVSLKSWNPIYNNVYYEFQQADIDLTFYKPSAGQMRYAMIAVLADLSAVEVKTSTARSTSDLPLDKADVNECIAAMTANSTPAWAVKLTGDMTSVTQQWIDNNAKDLRQSINVASGGGTGSVVGPGSSTDRAIATWNGTGGTTLRNNPLATVDANGLIKGMAYKLPTSTELTEASDAITITQGFHTVAAQTGTADDLATINGGVSAQFVTLQAKAAHTITVKSGTGNIVLNSGVDFVLSGDKTVTLFYDGTNWADTSAATNPVGPQGFMRNGKLVTSVASNNLTVAIKTLAGTDPSTTNPVYVRIGNTERPISAALSVTKNAGTNWMNLGAAEHATQDVDLFAFLGYNATDGVVLGFARFPYARVYGDFNTTSTNEKYAAISTITNAASTDEYENVGRFNATLSAGASYNWSIPATSIIVNQPCIETRGMAFVPTITASSGSFTSVSATGRYSRIGRQVFFKVTITITTNGTAAGATICTLPVAAQDFHYAFVGRENSVTGAMLYASTVAATTSVYITKYDNTYGMADGYTPCINGSYEAL